MDELAPVGAVYQAGTLSGNPLATAAGLAVLSLLDAEGYRRARAHRHRPRRRATGRARRAPVSPPRCRGRGTLRRVCSSPTSRCATYDEARAADHKSYARFFHALLDAGVYLPPSGYEAMFPSLAHSEADVAATINAAEQAVRA